MLLGFLCCMKRDKRLLSHTVGHSRYLWAFLSEICNQWASKADIPFVTVRVSIAVMHHRYQKQRGLHFHHWGKLARRSGQELGTGTEQKPWVRTAYWLTPHALLCFFLNSSQDHQPQHGTGPSIVNQEKYHRLTHRPIWWKHFLNWSSLSQNGSSLCRSDRTPASTLLLH